MPVSFIHWRIWSNSLSFPFVIAYRQSFQLLRAVAYEAFSFSPYAPALGAKLLYKVCDISRLDGHAASPPLGILGNPGFKVCTGIGIGRGEDEQTAIARKFVICLIFDRGNCR